MKKSKWLKWKIGFIGTLGLTILFQEVKTSSAFERAFINADKDQPTNSADLQDPVMDEFNSSVNGQDNQFHNNNSQSVQTETPTIPSSNRRSHTRTGRS